MKTSQIIPLDLDRSITGYTFFTLLIFRYDYNVFTINKL